MRIFLIACIILGFLIPACVIVTNVHLVDGDAVVFGEFVTATYSPTPTPTPTPTVTPTVIPTPNHTLTPTPMPSIEPTPTPIPDFDNYAIPYLQNSSEVKAFMLHDQTDKEVYRPTFRCYEMNCAVKAHAEGLGIYCELYYVCFLNHGTHCVLCFPTVDDGNVYVDSTNADWWVEPDFEFGLYHARQMNNLDFTWDEVITCFYLYDCP